MILMEMGKKSRVRQNLKQCMNIQVITKASTSVAGAVGGAAVGWVAISIEGESSEEEDKFSALHSRWVRLATKEEQKLREEGEPTCAHLYRELYLHVYNLTWLSPFTPLDCHTAAQGDFSVRAMECGVLFVQKPFVIQMD